MNSTDLGPFTENSDAKEQWISRIEVTVERAESSANMCEFYQTVYCMLNNDFSKLYDLDFPKDESRRNEARFDLREISMLLTKIRKLMKSMTFMQNMTDAFQKFISSLVNSETVTHYQQHEAIFIFEMFERNVWLLGETISRVKMTISEYQKKMEEAMKKYPKIDSNEE